MGMGKTVREFRCGDCGPRMRLAAAAGGRFHTEKRLHQRVEPCVGLLAPAALAVLYLAAMN